MFLPTFLWQYLNSRSRSLGEKFKEENEEDWWKKGRKIQGGDGADGEVEESVVG